VEELLAQDYRVDVEEALQRGWALFKAQWGLLLGGTILVYLALFAVNAIPYLSLILGFIFTGPLMGGLWLFYVRVVRGEVLTAGDAFGGFGPRFGQLLLAHLVTSILPGLCLVPAMAALVVFGISMSATGAQWGPLSASATGALVAFSLMFLLGLPVFVFLTVSWFFALPLVIDKRMDFWPAMSLSWRRVAGHWWGTFGLMVVLWLLLVAGLFLCIVGVVFAGCVAFAAMAVHYDKVFGALRAGP
jgi:hypothetical protein